MVQADRNSTSYFTAIAMAAQVGHNRKETNIKGLRVEMAKVELNKLFFMIKAKLYLPDPHIVKTH